MEEVWKDINLSTLHSEIPATPPLSLQLLPRPNHPSAPSINPSSFPGIILQDFLSGVTPPPHPCHHHRHHHQPPPIDLNKDCSPRIGSQTAQFGCCGNRKRPLEPQMSGGFCSGNDGSGDDRRHKRMIKNRESAARSRARKQAYTNELEVEVAQLVQENSKLRRQYEELRSAMAAQVPAKKKLQRASSALF